jgi:hypothetical protein
VSKSTITISHRHIGYLKRISLKNDDFLSKIRKIGTKKGRHQGNLEYSLLVYFFATLIRLIARRKAT